MELRLYNSTPINYFTFCETMLYQALENVDYAIEKLPFYNLIEESCNENSICAAGLEWYQKIYKELLEEKDNEEIVEIKHMLRQNARTACYKILSGDYFKAEFEKLPEVH